MTVVLDIESLDLEGRGVAHREGKVIFVTGALPGERIEAQPGRSKKNYELASMVRVLTPSSQRVEPACPHFGTCGGCAIQHLSPAAQVAVKQRVLEDALEHIGRVADYTVLPPLHGPNWHYRYRARLSTRFVRKKGGVLVGFREKRGAYVADMQECRVLPKQVSDLLMPLRELLGGLSTPDRLPQIELAMGDDLIVLNLRHMEALTDEDKRKLAEFGAARGVSWWLQPKGPDSVHPLQAEDAEKLAYSMPEFGLRMAFKPTDFTQVNHQLNRTMVSRALRLLQVESHHRVADMFCGLGNFSLPLATQAAYVLGVEGSETLTRRAQEAAQANGLAEKAEFMPCNLFEIDAEWLRARGHFDRMLIDPPREGAEALVTALSALAPAERPKRIVYVSCNPATLARDTAIMTEQGGYRLLAAGVMNMFPHTAHVESIAVFE